MEQDEEDIILEKFGFYYSYEDRRDFPHKRGKKYEITFYIDADDNYVLSFWKNSEDNLEVIKDKNSSFEEWLKSSIEKYDLEIQP